MNNFFVDVLFTFAGDADFYWGVAMISEEQVSEFERVCKTETPYIVFSSLGGIVYLNRSEVRCIRLRGIKEK